MWDLGALARDQTSASVLGAQSLNHQTAREVPSSRYTLIKVCLFFFLHNAVAHITTTVQYNITFVCAGKPKNLCDLLYVMLVLVISGTKPVLSPRCGCNFLTPKCSLPPINVEMFDFLFIQSLSVHPTNNNWALTGKTPETEQGRHDLRPHGATTLSNSFPETSCSILPWGNLIFWWAISQLSPESVHWPVKVSLQTVTGVTFCEQKPKMLLSFSVMSDSVDPMDCSTPGFPVPHYLLEFSQVHFLWVDDASQPSHPLSSSSPSAFSLSRHQHLFQ